MNDSLPFHHRYTSFHLAYFLCSNTNLCKVKYKLRLLKITFFGFPKRDQSYFIDLLQLLYWYIKYEINWCYCNVACLVTLAWILTSARKSNGKARCLKEEICPGKDSHFSFWVKTSASVYIENVDPLPKPRADNSSRAYSDFLTRSKTHSRPKSPSFFGHVVFN